MYKFLAIFMLMIFSGQLMADSSSSAVLYYSSTCGHCKKVLSFLQQENKTVTMRNVSDAASYAEYKALGTSGVPVMVVNGQVLKGADTIISYLKSHPEVMR